MCRGGRIKTMAKVDCSKTVNFIREKGRMCETYELCSSGCPMNTEWTCDTLISKCPEIAIEIVQKWSDEHQTKTRLDDMLKKHPKTFLNVVDKVPYIKPYHFGYCKECAVCPLRARSSVSLTSCWNEPVDGGATGKAVE